MMLNVVSYFVKSIAMASDSDTGSSRSSESSRESSISLSYECSSFGSGDESESEGVNPFLPIISIYFCTGSAYAITVL